MQNKTKKYIKIFTAFATTLIMLFSGNIVYSQGTSSSTGTSSSIDALEPSDVENLKATAGDGETQLTWDSARDNVAVTGYKIYRGTRSVKTSEEHYDLPAIPTGNVKNYTVKNLTNGQTYYFTITAVDSAGNESINYANEVSATPKSGLRLASVEDDGKAPQVKEIKAEDIITVTIEFSEPVKLPEEQPASAFQIEKVSQKTRLPVQKAEIDSRDKKGATVLLTTAPQEENEEYVITSGIEIKDLFNNPIISGTSDTGSFKGSAKKKPNGQLTVSAGAQEINVPPSSRIQPAPPSDTQAPLMTGGSADFNNRIAITFSEKIELPQNSLKSFTVVKKGTSAILDLINVSLSVDGTTVYLTTDPQEPAEYEVKVQGIKDLAGNEVTTQNNSITVTGKGSALKDLMPPEDITKLIARIKDAGKNIVELRWQGSKNSAKDLVDQLLYESKDKEGKAYGAGKSLGTSTMNTEIDDLEPGNWYTFKVTAKDNSQNESKGAITSIYLPETGPGAIAAGLTGLFMGWYRKKKKK